MDSVVKPHSKLKQDIEDRKLKKMTKKMDRGIRPVENNWDELIKAANDLKGCIASYASIIINASNVLQLPGVPVELKALINENVNAMSNDTINFNRKVLRIEGQIKTGSVIDDEIMEFVSTFQELDGVAHDVITVLNPMSVCINDLVDTAQEAVRVQLESKTTVLSTLEESIANVANLSDIDLSNTILPELTNEGAE